MSIKINGLFSQKNKIKWVDNKIKGKGEEH